MRRSAAAGCGGFMPRDDRVGALIAQAIDGQAQSITLLLEAVVGLREDMRALREDLGPVVSFAKAQQEREEASVMDARVAAAVAAQVEAIKATEAKSGDGGGGGGGHLFDRKTIAGAGALIVAVVIGLLERLFGGVAVQPPAAPAALPMDDAPTVLEALDETEGGG